ncbi:hypothetical protein P7C70_g6379, partial [Phenoliferia sp. Uapishka_3]
MKEGKRKGDRKGELEASEKWKLKKTKSVIDRGQNSREAEAIAAYPEPPALAVNLVTPPNMPTDASPPPSRACFTILPPELKATIVEMAFFQERTYRERVPEKDRVEHTNSLSSLALVNRELRRLAAKHQFEELSSTRVEHMTFRFSILPYHSQHITHVSLKSGDEATLSQTLSIMLQLPALRALTFHADAAYALLNDFVDSGFISLTLDYDTTEAIHARILQRLGPKIQSLDLDGFMSTAAGTLVGCFPNLRTLALNDVLGGREDPLEKLSIALVSLRSLSHLSLQAEEELHPSTLALDTLRAHPPPIQCLHLYLGDLNQPLLDFTTAFGATLKALELRVWTTESSPVADSPFPHLHLPHLSRLVLVDHGWPTPQLSAVFTNTNLRSLSFVAGQTSELDEVHIAKLITTQTNLRHLQLGKTSFPSFLGSTYLRPRDRSYLPPALLAYTNLIHSRDLDTSVLQDAHLSPFYPRAVLDYTESEIEYLSKALVQTLDFGRNEVGRMVAEGNVKKAVKWVEVLRGLEEERSNWRD